MDNALLITAVSFGLLFLLLASGMWVSIAMAVVGIVLLLFWVGKGNIDMLGFLQYNTLDSFTLTAVPMFIFMGEVMVRGRLGELLYRGSSKWAGFLPGGLLHTNTIACAIFSAISGSSMATAATVGTVAIPELQRRGYDWKLTLGSLAGGGTLGILVPPSLPMIIYGAFVGASVGKLFLAGWLPGLTLAGLFTAYIAAHAWLRPRVAPDRVKLSLIGLISSLPDLLPSMVLIFLILVTIYAGLGTPTEAAAIGGFVALILSAVQRTLTWDLVKGAALSTMQVTSWVSLIVIAAQVMSMGLSYLQVPQQLAAVVAALQVDKLVILTLITLVYLALGMFLEGLAMMLLTLPVIYPLMTSLGFDPIWFGVMLVVYIEMGQLTPPIGVNLFIIHGLSERKHLRELNLGVIPFVGCQVILIILLTAFPSLATWLPGRLMP